MASFKKCLRWPLVVVVLAAVLGGTSPALAQSDPTGDSAQELAERYVPRYSVATFDAPCGEGEAWEPTSVDIILGNRQVLLRQTGSENPILTRAPVASDMYGLGEGFFLDMPGVSTTPGCVYKKDFAAFAEGRDPVVYAHVVQQPEFPDRIALQYWTYWYFNQWNNTHETDWEFTQVIFEASTIEEALASEPIEVGYSQHFGGERADWGDEKIALDGTHTIVYSGAGSHASYYGQAVFLGRAGNEGLGCDETTGDRRLLSPEVILMPHAPDGPDDEFAWLAFDGRWGERHTGPFDAPTGPASKDRYMQPIDWQETLREDSLEVPLSDPSSTSDSDDVISTFCYVVAKGGAATQFAIQSPGMAIGLAAIALVIIMFLVRQTAWGHAASPLVRKRSAGQIITTAFDAYRKSRGALLAVAAMYLPVVALKSVSSSVAGSDSTIRFVLGLVDITVASIMIAVVVAYWEHADQPEPLRRAISLAWKKRYQLVFTYLLVLGIGLGILFVAGRTSRWLGLIGLFFFIRTLFAVPVVIHEDVSGFAALRRSWELTRRGRWVFVALVVIVSTMLVAGLNTGLALLYLMFAKGLPLGVFSILLVLVTVLTFPLSATATAMLYGNTVAERHSEEDQPLGQPTAAS